jgi:hypothetical protein
VNSKLDNVTAREGETAKFKVKVSGGNPKPEVKWFFEEEEIIIEEEFYEIEESEDTVTLIIKTVKPHQAGSYHAEIVNEAGSVKTNKAQLNINSKHKN